jgi:hypothetical protein
MKHLVAFKTLVSRLLHLVVILAVAGSILSGIATCYAFHLLFPIVYEDHPSLQLLPQ